MDKRYQVFVSSTYADLKEERQTVIQTLMEMDCIPAGMELFPAADEEQLNFIKRIIDDCDYYILIIGGRYGSLTPEGISYTEQEFDYAVAKGIKVVAFLHGDPQSIIVAKTDNDPELSKLLNAFREKAKTGRLVKYWQAGGDLPGLVALSMLKTIRTHPAVGWVRATTAASAELLQEINELRKENAELRLHASTTVANAPSPMNDLVDMTDTLLLFGKYTKTVQSRDTWLEWEYEMSWSEIFALIAPSLMVRPHEKTVGAMVPGHVLRMNGKQFWESTIDYQVLQTIKIQLKAYGLITIEYTKIDVAGGLLIWGLSEKGESMMESLRSVRKLVPASSSPPDQAISI